MAPKELVQEWINKAEEDYGFAVKTLADPSMIYFAQICFHFQQAAEKYLKAYIVAFDLAFMKIHDLPELLRICMEKEPGLEALSDDCEFLTDFYIETRYPVHWPSSVTKEDAEKAKAATEKIRVFIRKQLHI